MHDCFFCFLIKQILIVTPLHSPQWYFHLQMRWHAIHPNDHRGALQRWGSPSAKATERILPQAVELCDSPVWCFAVYWSSSGSVFCLWRRCLHLCRLHALVLRKTGLCVCVPTKRGMNVFVFYNFRDISQFCLLMWVLYECKRVSVGCSFVCPVCGCVYLCVYSCVCTQRK